MTMLIFKENTVMETECLYCLAYILRIYLILNQYIYWFKNPNFSQMPVAYTCNPSYSGSRDHKDQGSKPAWANSSQNLISKKKKITKKGWWSVSGCRPWVQTPVLKKKKKRKRRKKERKKNLNFKILTALCLSPNTLFSIFCVPFRHQFSQLWKW
jgi:hypothetical protein